MYNKEIGNYPSVYVRERDLPNIEQGAMKFHLPHYAKSSFMHRLGAICVGSRTKVEIPNMTQCYIKIKV